MFLVTPSTYYAQTETWDGSSWTEVNDLNNQQDLLGAGSGIATSALAFAGRLSSLLL